MAENKTKATKSSAARFLDGITDQQKRADCKAVAKMMRAVTGKNAKMWGSSSIVGYGTYDYQYASGRAGSFFLSGFSPRAQNITIYVMSGFSKHESLLKKLGKHSIGKSCLYIKNLEDIDAKVLRSLVESSVKYMHKTYRTY
jgi:hypothetical protein